MRTARAAGFSTTLQKLARVYQALSPSYQLQIIRPSETVTVDEYINHLKEQQKSYAAAFKSQSHGTINSAIIQGQLPGNAYQSDEFEIHVDMRTEEEQYWSRPDVPRRPYDHRRSGLRQVHWTDERPQFAAQQYNQNKPSYPTSQPRGSDFRRGRGNGRFTQDNRRQYRQEDGRQTTQDRRQFDDRPPYNRSFGQILVSAR